MFTVWIETVVIPEGMKIIGSSAFADCASLKETVFSSTLEVISNEAFKNCISLEKLQFNGDVNRVGAAAFENCKKLKNFTMSEKIAISSGVFAGCESLSLTAKGETENYIVGEHYIINTINGEKELIWCNDTSRLPADGSYTSIGKGVFEGCGNVTEYTVPPSVKFIRNGAFQNCPSLKKITFSGSAIIFIPDNAFSCCTALESVTFGGKEYGIGEGAFEGCTALRELVLPEAMTTIGEGAFYGCTALESVTFGGKPHSILSN